MKAEVPARFMVPCPKATRGSIDPETATGVDVGGLIVVLGGLNDACAIEHNGLIDLLKDFVTLKGD